MKKTLWIASLVTCLAGTAFADTFTLSAINGGAATGSPRLNLDNLILGNSTQAANAALTISFSGSGASVQNSANGLYAAPYVSGTNGVGFGSPDQPNGLDTTRYLSTGIGSITFQFNSSQTYFGLLWGSVDNFNTLSFFRGADQVGSFTGTNVFAAANGDQGVQGTFYVNIQDLNGSFDRIVASSTSYAFEIDNVAYNANGVTGVADGGSSLALAGMAFGGLVIARRRRA